MLLVGLFRLFIIGTVTNAGTFNFTDCTDKQLLVWEEPFIKGDMADTCKLVFEGAPAQVKIKYRNPETLNRTPIIITTNKPIWHFCSSVAFL